MAAILSWPHYVNLALAEDNLHNASKWLLAEQTSSVEEMGAAENDILYA